MRLHHRFPHSYREVEEFLLKRGITVAREYLGLCAAFGPTYARQLRTPALSPHPNSRAPPTT
ncbi:hypothetical protein GCM10010245_89700 [Streptomyces spectabilis]|nr:hypothetical protein GCM10010245_89700 [Streptomyces spectabilis]